MLLFRWEPAQPVPYTHDTERQEKEELEPVFHMTRSQGIEPGTTVSKRMLPAPTKRLPLILLLDDLVTCEPDIDVIGYFQCRKIPQK